MSDSGNNCLRLLNDTDSTVDGSVVLGTSPSKSAAAAAVRAGVPDASVTHYHSKDVHTTRPSPGRSVNQGGVPLRELNAWMLNAKDGDDDDDDELYPQGACAQQESSSNGLAYTRAMLESSDSSASDEEPVAQTQDPARHSRALPHDEAKAAWEVSRQVSSRVKIGMKTVRKWLLTFTQLLCRSKQREGAQVRLQRSSMLLKGRLTGFPGTDLPLPALGPQLAGFRTNQVA